MYDWSRRHNAPQACFLYAQRMVIQRLAPGAFYPDDESCWHDEACSRCKFSFESDNPDDWYCLIQEGLHIEGLSFSRAYNQARERIREIVFESD